MPQPIDAATRLKLGEFIERLENLTWDRKALSKQITQVYKEAEGFGLDKKALRTALKLLSIGPEERAAITDVAQFYVDVVTDNGTSS